MTTAGSVVIDILARTGSFETDTKRAEKRLKEFKKEAIETGKAVGAGLAAGVGVATAFLAKYVANTVEAEKVAAQLMARLEDTGGVAGRSLKELSDQAERLSKITVFDDEAIGDAQAMLLTFTQIRDVEFDKTIESALDLATVMGMDATQAAKLLGKALQDPEKGLTALAKAGVVFTDAERERIKRMVEAGEAAEAQELILKKLEGTMGSAAEAARNTLGGAIQGLMNDFDNLLEGDVSQGGLKGTVDAIAELSETINDPQLKDGIDSLASGLLTTANYAVEAAAKLGNLVSTYTTWLKNQGFMQGETIDQLEKNRDRLVKQRGSVLGQIANLNGGELDAKIAEIDNEIERLKAQGKALFSDTDKMPDSFFRGARKPRGPADPETPPSSGGSGKKGTAGGKSTNWLEEDTRKLKEMVEAEARAREEFDAMAASLAGPVADANYRFATDLERLNDLAKQGAIGADELAAAQGNLRKEHEANLETIERQLNPGKELLNNLRFEIELMKMGNVERQTAIALRGMEVDQIRKYGDEIAEANRELEEQAKHVEVMDDFRDTFKDFFKDVLSGTKSIGDSFEDMLDRIGSMIEDRIAQNWVDQLFGEKGQSGGGVFGGWLNTISGWLSSSGGGGASGGGDMATNIAEWFGGARAGGGDVFGNRAYLVGEQGPEMFVPRTAGAVLPADATAQVMGRSGRSTQLNQNFYVQGAPDRRTREQMARDSGRAAARGISRTGR